MVLQWIANPRPSGAPGSDSPCRHFGMALEGILETTAIVGTFVAMVGTVYGVSHMTYKVYTDKILKKIIKDYEKEKKNNKDF